MSVPTYLQHGGAPDLYGSSSRTLLASPLLSAAYRTTFDATAATNDETPHVSGWKATIHLDKEGRTETGIGRCWRSGEVLKGHVEVTKTGNASELKPIASIVARAFWTSMTIFTATRALDAGPAPTGMLAKLKPQGVQVRAVTEQKMEWHRGFLLHGGEGCELWNGGILDGVAHDVVADFPLLGDEAVVSGGETTHQLPRQGQEETMNFPFTFALPTLTAVSEANLVRGAPPSRRVLQRLPRTPPPSLTGTNGVVEWAVEVLVRFQDPSASLDAALVPDETESVPRSGEATFSEEELPSFDALPKHAPGAMDFGLMSTSPSLLVTRIVFPFEALDNHASDLYSAWRPSLDSHWTDIVAKNNGLTLDETQDERVVDTPRVPQFGKDPRDEALGGSFVGPRRELMGGLFAQEGGRDKWVTFEKRSVISGLLGRSTGWIRVEASMPKPCIVARHALSLPILLHLSYTTPPSTTPKATMKLKPVSIDKILITLSARTLTRGGRDERPRFHLDEIRREEIKLWSEELAMTDTRASRKSEVVEGGRMHLNLYPGKPGKDIKVAFDLQSESFDDESKKACKPLREQGLSFRTPNIEREYVLSITVSPTRGMPPFYVLRAPLQVIAGDLDAPPAFEAGFDTAPPQPQQNPQGQSTDLPGYHD